MKFVLRFIFSLVSTILVSLFLVTLLFIVFMPIFFGVLTFILSMLMFSRLEYDKALHDREFYSTQPHKQGFLFLIGILTNFQVLVQSIGLSILSVILFSGTDINRISTLALIFVFLVGIGLIILRLFEKKSHVNIERWGYVKISLLLGLFFSLLISTVDGLNLWDIGKSIVRQQFSGLDFDEVAELIYGFSAQMNNLLEITFTKLFGNVAGKAISLIFTTNATFGFVIYVYVVQYLRFQSKYRNFVDRITSNEQLTESYSE